MASPDDELALSPETRIGIALPVPLSVRLDVLVDLANRAGARTNRKEVLGAVLLAAPESSEGLAELVRALRTARARDTFVQGQPEETFLEPPQAKPGPRARRRT